MSVLCFVHVCVCGCVGLDGCMGGCACVCMCMHVCVRVCVYTYICLI